jgi:hypothetical protein
MGVTTRILGAHATKQGVLQGGFVLSNPAHAMPPKRRLWIKHSGRTTGLKSAFQLGFFNLANYIPVFDILSRPGAIGVDARHTFKPKPQILGGYDDLAKKVIGGRFHDLPFCTKKENSRLSFY